MRKSEDLLEGSGYVSYGRDTSAPVNATCSTEDKKHATLRETVQREVGHGDGGASPASHQVDSFQSHLSATQWRATRMRSPCFSRKGSGALPRAGISQASQGQQFPSRTLPASAGGRADRKGIIHLAPGRTFPPGEMVTGFAAPHQE